MKPHLSLLQSSYATLLAGAFAVATISASQKVCAEATTTAPKPQLAATLQSCDVLTDKNTIKKSTQIPNSVAFDLVFLEGSQEPGVVPTEYRSNLKDPRFKSYKVTRCQIYLTQQEQKVRLPNLKEAELHLVNSTTSSESKVWVQLTIVKTVVKFDFPKSVDANAKKHSTPVALGNLFIALER